MYASLQEDMNHAKIELSAARKAQAEAKRVLTAYNKAQVAGHKLAAKAQKKIYRVHEQLTIDRNCRHRRNRAAPIIVEDAAVNRIQ